MTNEEVEVEEEEEEEEEEVEEEGSCRCMTEIAPSRLEGILLEEFATFAQRSSTNSKKKLKTISLNKEAHSQRLFSQC